MVEPITQVVQDTPKKNIDIGELFRKYGLLLAFVILCTVFAIMSPVFLTQSNVTNILNQVSINAILAIGVTFVILIAGIDLGLGSYVALTGVLAALSSSSGQPLIASISFGIAAGLAIGFINGLTVTKGRLASFIVTLGMMTITRGGALVISDGRPVSNLSPSFNHIGNGSFLGIPIPIVIVIVVFLIAMFVLNKTVFGRYIYAVGGNEEAARASGISVNKIKMYVYIICGGLAGLAGIIQAARINTGQPNIGVGYELDAIAAAVIGGTSLSGGAGKITGTIIGALIIGVINNGLDLLGVSSYWQSIIKGGIIIGALLLDRRSNETKS
ncbi:ABC transporter permease [Fredinandcohnia onubensis]|uniref:ABC transporter permease n=1 Tax=Fredinandcohnia onubensis TaxID=1571209 RepID=UPI000C0BDBD1|nr:ribose ABC transporter permease [Fredinandcohnia onubensis]